MRFTTSFTKLALLTFGVALCAQAQTPSFLLEIEEVTVSNAPAIHSMAHAEHNDLWLFVAGRVDGLHVLLPNPNPFPPNQSNNSILVYDQASDQLWTASLDELPDAVADPLRTTNGQFWQDGETLYYVGGYGYENATEEKITFGNLMAIDIPGMIDAVQNATSLSAHIRQMVSDDTLKVAGGHLIKFDDTYHLVGGNRFDGEYMGGAIQTYTESVRSFDIDDNGTTLGISGLSEMVDVDNLHRRDINVSPVILDNGNEGFALFGGVFQVGANLPFYNPIYFDGASMDVDETFEAQFGHYTQPMIPLYSESTEVMHTVFIGGMNQFYYDEDSESVVEDLLVPFVDDVTAISRSSDGTTIETVLPLTLPGLLGTNAAFFFNEDLPVFDNGVIKLDELDGRTLIGHMIGGIESSAPNAGWMEQPTEASDRLFAVYVTGTSSAEYESPVSYEVLTASPNPFREETQVRVRLDQPQSLLVEVFDMLGKRIALLNDRPLPAGTHSFAIDGSGLAQGAYVVRIIGSEGRVSQQLVHIK